jgi:hypothetical protein
MKVLAADSGISLATGYRYLHEGIDALAARAPDLHEVLEAGKAAGWTHVVLDGTLIETDRCRVKNPDTGHDLWFSGKHRTHGGNVQIVCDPEGFPAAVSDVHLHEGPDPRDEAAVPEPAASKPERRTHYELDQDDRGRDPIHEGRDPRGEVAGAAEDQRRPADLAKARAARKLLAERAAERGRAAKDKTPQPGSMAAALAKVRAEAQLRAEQAAQQAERKRQEQLATQVRPVDRGRERD